MGLDGQPPDAGPFDEEYYRGNGQIGDRPALWYYTRLLRGYSRPGPLLDYGCGTGHLVRRLGAHGPADGFEVSEYSARTARRVAPAAQIFTDSAELPSGAYAGVACIHVVEHLTDSVVTDTLRTFRRILRPDGVALVVTPDLGGFGRALAQENWDGFADVTHINLKAHADWHGYLEHHGFRVLREGSDGLWNVPYRRLPKLVDAAVHAGPALAQFLSGRLFLRPGTGESSLFVIAPDPG